MVAKIATPFGHPLPPFSPHAITIHAQGWTTLDRFVAGDPEIMSQLKAIYPRFGPFNQTKALIGAVMSKLGPGQMCFLFPNKASAEACKDFVISAKPMEPEQAIEAKDVSVKAYDFHVRLYATVFPMIGAKTAVQFWQDPGVAISTRLAEDCLKHIDVVKEVDLQSEPLQWPSTAAFETLKSRIADLLERAPAFTHSKRVTSEDVYLFQTGMASIYLPHLYLSATRPGTSILYGFAFHSTPHIFERFGANTSNFKWFARGGDLEIEALESFVEQEHAEGRRIQALWAEFPTNPNLITPNLKKLRAIADKFSFPVIIDDTISSFANVDLFGDSGADVLSTSLTKSFSGYADVMGGSIALNPASKHYAEFKDMFSKHYQNDLYSADAEALEKNSRDYLKRTVVLNRNAHSLASFLSDPRFSHQIEQIHYPSTLSTKSNYDPYLRASTDELPTPGYGCLLSIGFKTLEQAIAFYDNVRLHCGPHLGAHLTLVMPYTKLLIAQAKSDDVVVNKGGMSEKMMRISVGLEDEKELLEAFEHAMLKADEIVKQKGANGNPVE